MAATVKTRVLIISDTHCALLTQRDGHFRDPVPPFRAPLPAADMLIHCGDLTFTGKLEQYHHALDMLKNIDAPVKLVIAGNHDISLDREFVLGHIGKAPKGAFKWDESVDEAETQVEQMKDLWQAPEGRAKKEGVMVLEEGVHTIDLQNGSRLNVYASPYTPEFCDWGFSYDRNEDRFNLPETSLLDATNIASNPIPSFSSSQAPIDIAVTHGPPYGRLDEVNRGGRVGCPHLLRALMHARPLVHCFGHIHEGSGAERIRWSDDADKVASDATTIKDWQQSKWLSGIANDGLAIDRLQVDMDTAKERHGIFVDISDGGDLKARRGQETLLVNSSIMDVKYNPVNPPWIVDLDLPKRETANVSFGQTA